MNSTDQIGRYTVLEALGEGEFSSVYLAVDPELNRRVAIKISREALSQSYDKTHPLLNEARILAHLKHTSVLMIFDVGQHNGRPYAVFEYVEGSLDKELQESTDGISTQRIADMIAQTAEAVDHVHRRGFLHCNLQPRTILINDLGRVRLSGFEVAVRRNEKATTRGTPAFMAPEQMSGETAYLGSHTDVWGLGVTLVAALANNVFWHRPAPEIIPELERLKEGAVPTELLQICTQCIAVQPSDRYASADLLAEDLREWLRSTGRRKQSRVFVSHSTQDRAFVESEIIALLEGCGVKTWYSKVDIQTAVEWERSIVQGLQTCNWFLLVMSPHSAKSEWVKDEIHWAIQQRPKNMIPVIIDECDPCSFHIRMSRIQSIDFRSNLQEAKKRLANIFESSDQAVPANPLP